MLGVLPELADKMNLLLANCAARGIKMVPYSGVRTPQEQAALWAKSRSQALINSRVTFLKDQGAPHLASILAAAKPGIARKVTNSLPGSSWHNWKEAVDCYWEVGGKAEWNDLKGYKIYAEEANKIGLTAGGLWPNFKDWPHVQLRAQASPYTAGVSWADIDAKMKELFP